MSSAFFRRPGDDSSGSNTGSDDESSAEEAEVEEQATRSSDADTSSHDIELATTESLSTNASVALPETDADSNMTSLDQHRNNMFAALLEDYYKNRAAVFLNSTNPGANFTKDSAEVRVLSDRLYAEGSRELVQNGIIPPTTSSGERSNQHGHYLSALDSLAYRNLKDGAISSAHQHQHIEQGESGLALVRANSQSVVQQAAYLDRSTNEVITNAGRIGISSPQSDMALTISRQNQHSHYESSFQQLKLLGKGGFGRVYHAHSIFDRKEYAIKKIPLSPRLTRSYQQGGHEELESVLREVQALAQLDHSNVVRYHATWIEEPKSSPRRSSGQGHAILPLPRRRLLADRPHEKQWLSGKPDPSEGIVFGYDSSRPPSFANDSPNGWSINDALHNSNSVRESQIFTDGLARGSASTDSALDDTVCVLHVQMSLYPMTLAQYLAPIASTSSSPPSSPQRRHCYHLVPSLRILMGILCGLQYIHAKGLIHRDIKPGNIFLSYADHATNFTSSEGYHDVGACTACPDYRAYHLNPRIGDFGLVAELARSDIKIESPTNSPSSPSKPVGTEFYRPPHASDANGQKRKPSIDEKIDVYALGIVLVELLWKCDTSSERMHVLRDLQRGRLPRALSAVVDSEGHHAGTGDLVRELVRNMIEQDAAARWGCQRVKDCILEILARCREWHGGSEVTKVRSLNGTEESVASSVESGS